MRDETTWVPYQGALRGAVGVLMDRKGNSLDRALLLAALLRTAGYNVRLSHTQLAPEQAGRIVKHFREHAALVGQATRLAAAPSQMADLDKKILKGAQSYGLDEARVQQGIASARIRSDRLAADLVARVGDQTPRLFDAVAKSHESATPAADSSSAALAAAADHWWVQRQDAKPAQADNNAQWLEMDPAVAA